MPTCFEEYAIVTLMLSHADDFPEFYEDIEGRNNEEKLRKTIWDKIQSFGLIET